MRNTYAIILNFYLEYQNIFQNHKNGQTTQTSNVKRPDCYELMGDDSWVCVIFQETRNCLLSNVIVFVHSMLKKIKNFMVAKLNSHSMALQNIIVLIIQMNK